jgi:hypothetical protein
MALPDDRATPINAMDQRVLKVKFFRGDLIRETRG